MTFPANPSERSPKGDHNRRLSLGIDADLFARRAGISAEELREYEETGPDHHFRIDVAQRVGNALEALEATMQGKVDNGPVPSDGAGSGNEQPLAPLMNPQLAVCPISLDGAELLAVTDDLREYRCPSCGRFKISDAAVALAGDDRELLAEALAVAKLGLSDGEVPVVTNVSG